MKENVNTVETNTKIGIIELLKNIFWNSEEISEDVKLPRELLEVREKWTENAKKLNDVEVVSEGNKLKGLKGQVKVVKAPTIQGVNLNYSRSQNHEENDQAKNIEKE